MRTSKNVEIGVGIFILVSLISLAFLSIKVSTSSLTRYEPTYSLYADFDNVSGLNVKSPVRIGGVVIGRIEEITLSPQSYRPRVKISIAKRYSSIPETSMLVSRTSGLLGDKYLAILPGFIDSDVAMLKPGDTIEHTQSPVALEDLIGQFIYKSPPKPVDQ